MSERVIVISDANILFDLLSTELMDAFCRLPYDKWTSDFILQEIKDPSQKEIINNTIASNDLFIKNFTFEEIIAIKDFQVINKHLSISDCSVWHMAKKMDARLLSGDRKLRIAAEADGIKVSGILFVFDELIAHEVIDSQTAASKLIYLMSVNNRLPKADCDERLKEWSTSSLPADEQNLIRSYLQSMRGEGKPIEEVFTNIEKSL